jgi:hypothetical protein
VESWFSSIRLLSDAVVVEVLGVLSNCPASDAEPTMFMTMQHSTRRRRLRPRCMPSATPADVLARRRHLTLNGDVDAGKRARAGHWLLG